MRKFECLFYFKLFLSVWLYSVGQGEGQFNWNKKNDFGRETKNRYRTRGPTQKNLGPHSILNRFPSAHSFQKYDLCIYICTRYYNVLLWQKVKANWFIFTHVVLPYASPWHKRCAPRTARPLSHSRSPPIIAPGCPSKLGFDIGHLIWPWKRRHPSSHIHLSWLTRDFTSYTCLVPVWHYFIMCTAYYAEDNVVIVKILF